MSPEPVGLLSATARIGGYRSVVQFRENITRYVDPLSTEKNSIYWDRSETPTFTTVNCRSIIRCSTGRRHVKFRENAAPYRAARSRKKIAYGVLRAGIRARTAVHGPPS